MCLLSGIREVCGEVVAGGNGVRMAVAIGVGASCEPGLRGVHVHAVRNLLPRLFQPVHLAAEDVQVLGQEQEHPAADEGVGDGDLEAGGRVHVQRAHRPVLQRSDPLDAVCEAELQAPRDARVCPLVPVAMVVHAVDVIYHEGQVEVEDVDAGVDGKPSKRRLGLRRCCYSLQYSGEQTSTYIILLYYRPLMYRYVCIGLLTHILKGVRTTALNNSGWLSCTNLDFEFCDMFVISSTCTT
eukprot:4193524-Pyramimonas_sp.AAC.1